MKTKISKLNRLKTFHPHKTIYQKNKTFQTIRKTHTHIKRKTDP